MAKDNSKYVKVLEHPFAKVSQNERKEIIDEVQKKSIINYKNSLAELQDILKKYNPIIILSQLSTYALLGGIGDEVVSMDSRTISQAHVEICQALLLQINPEELNVKSPSPEIIQRTIDSLNSLLESNLYKNWDSDSLNLSEKERNVRYFRDYVIAHTQSVRN